VSNNDGGLGLARDPTLDEDVSVDPSLLDDCESIDRVTGF
jgi:hypothetical protein